MRVVYMGTPAFAIPPLEELLAEGYDVVGVYTQPDRPAGRGRSLEAPPVKAFAQERGLDVFQPTSLRNADAHSRLAALAPDVIAIAAYGRILPEEVVNMAPAGCVNVHPSLLPRHRGPSPVAFTILEGDETAGVSIMLLDEGMDSGPVIAQVEEAIHPDDTTESLTDRLFHRGAKLLVECLPPFLQGEIAPRPQDESKATYAPRLAKEDGEIRWELPAETLWRQVRAYHPWPGAYTRWNGRLLKALEAVPLTGVGADAPGRVVALDRDAPAPVGVSTGEGVLGLRRVQLEGRRAVDAADFLKGHEGFVGSTLSG